MEQDTKLCRRCGETKPLSEFHRRSDRPCGRQSRCRACRSELNRAWEAANRERRVEYRQNYWVANRDRELARQRAWRIAHPGYAREWYVANQDRYREAWRRYNARKRGALVAGAEFTVTQLAARLSMFSGCWLCGGLADSVDHVKPLAKGGLHILANLRPVCRSCNSAKRDRWVPREEAS